MAARCSGITGWAQGSAAETDGRLSVAVAVGLAAALWLTARDGCARAPASAPTSNQGVSLSRAHPFMDLGDNAVRSFTGVNLALHALGVASAPVLIVSGADAAVHDAMARHQALEPYSVAGVYLGYGAPLVVGGGLFAAAFLGDSQRELRAASAVLQATGFALAYQSVLKAFTGRPAPPPGVLDDDDAAREFRFGFLRGGIHYGWPSGHMMTTSAIYASLLQVYPGNLWVGAVGGVVVAGMFGSVALHEESSMHWFSDMVSGTAMGFAIGRGVGAGFAASEDSPGQQAAWWSLSPWLGANGARGLAVGGAF